MTYWAWGYWSTSHATPSQITGTAHPLKRAMDTVEWFAGRDLYWGNKFIAIKVITSSTGALTID